MDRHRHRSGRKEPKENGREKKHRSWICRLVEIRLGHLGFKVHRFVEDAGDFDVSLFGTIDQIMFSDSENAATGGEIFAGFASGTERVFRNDIPARFQEPEINPKLLFAPSLQSVAENRKQIFIRDF